MVNNLFYRFVIESLSAKVIWLNGDTGFKGTDRLEMKHLRYQILSLLSLSVLFGGWFNSFTVAKQGE